MIRHIVCSVSATSALLMAAGANVPAAKAPAAPRRRRLLPRLPHPRSPPSPCSSALSTPRRALAGLDLKRMLTSPLGKMLDGQLDATGWKQKASAQGLDFAADVDRVIVSSPGEAGGNKAALSEEAPFIASMQGKLQIEKLRKALLAKRAARLLHQGAEVWMAPKTEIAVAIVNSQLLVLGTGNRCGPRSMPRTRRRLKARSIHRGCAQPSCQPSTICGSRPKPPSMGCKIPWVRKAACCQAWISLSWVCRFARALRRM